MGLRACRRHGRAGFYLRPVPVAAPGQLRRGGRRSDQVAHQTRAGPPPGGPGMMAAAAQKAANRTQSHQTRAADDLRPRFVAQFDGLPGMPTSWTRRVLPATSASRSSWPVTTRRPTFLTGRSSNEGRAATPWPRNDGRSRAKAANRTQSHQTRAADDLRPGFAAQFDASREANDGRQLVDTPRAMVQPPEGPGLRH